MLFNNFKVFFYGHGCDPYRKNLPGFTGLQCQELLEAKMQTLGCILECYAFLMYIDILGDSTSEETPLLIFSHSCKTHKRHLS